MKVTTPHERVLEHLSAITGKLHALNQNNKSLIDNVLKNGYTEADMISVIDKKADDWLGNEYAVYLRPETLFGPKFPKYLIHERRNDKSRIDKLTDAVRGAKRSTWRLDKKRP